VLGLDPGSRTTGYAVIECSGIDAVYLASGAIRTLDESFPARLQEIFAGVARLVGEYRPDEVAIERVFMHRNPDSALKLGQARGAALCGTFAGQPGEPPGDVPASRVLQSVASRKAATRQAGQGFPRVYEYAPREIKLAVVGTGGAQKEQVQLMVKQLLRLSARPGADAADALAVALCHVHSRRLQARGVR